MVELQFSLTDEIVDVKDGGKKWDGRESEDNIGF